MKRIILYITSSIDGRIAGPEAIESFREYPASESLNRDYREFTASIDTVIMGGKTYRELLTRDIVWPYGDRTTYVISRHDWGAKDTVRFITGNIAETVGKLRTEPGRDIWLTGGGETVSMLLKAGLVDEMRILYLPVILGGGAPLFPGQPRTSQWVLSRSREYDNGVVEHRYTKR